MTTDERDTRQDHDEDEDRSLIEKAKDKLDDLMEVPEAADDPRKTNAVTGHPREP